jgi:hypothetical protein
MIERIINDVITAGLAWFTADLDRLEAFFQDEHGLSSAETAKIRAYYAMNPDDADDWGGPPKLIHGYPRSSGPWPCWAIILNADRSERRMLGDDAGTMDTFDDETDLDGEAAIPLVRLANFNVGIDTYVPDNPDICRYNYYLLRFIIWQAVGTFQDSPNYLQNVEFSGADLAPNPQYLPDNIWVRRLTLTCFAEEAAWEAKSEPTGVGGAHATDETTGVTGGITPYQE